MAKDMNISCHHLEWRDKVSRLVNLLPIARTTRRKSQIRFPKDQTKYILQCSLVGTSGPAVPLPLLPLTSVFLSSYLWPPHLMQTLISTSCVLVQWNDLPQATWQDMNSVGPPPASCSLLIRRCCAGFPVAGLSFPTLFPTSHASFPLPLAKAIARCWGLRNMWATASGLENWTPFWASFEVVGLGVGGAWQEGRGRPNSKATNNLYWLKSLTHHNVPPNISPTAKLSHPSFLCSNVVFGG